VFYNENYFFLLRRNLNQAPEPMAIKPIKLAISGTGTTPLPDPAKIGVLGIGAETVPPKVTEGSSSSTETDIHA
ncbi:MAG: hypothetical protein JW735_05065, partial [Prolixibacteraceae bacterium]|nr:hypothetical protein [Prolixibacteraceae bacterium]